MTGRPRLVLRTLSTAASATVAGSDDALVAAARESSEAFGDLYRLYLPRVYRYLSTRTASPEEAADLTQQVFLRAFHALPGYRAKEAPFTAWLFRIARNAA